jgi:hypothetical protein
MRGSDSSSAAVAWIDVDLALRAAPDAAGRRGLAAVLPTEWIGSSEGSRELLEGGCR